MTEGVDETAGRLAAVGGRIAAACAAAGRPADAVRLVAVSKRKPIDAIRAAYAAGQRDFGENYAQELQHKAAALADLADLRWHFIGPLQRNKAKLLVGHAVLLHSVTSEGQLAAVARQAEARQLEQRFLIQLNLSGEPTKAGVDEQQATRLIEAAAAAPAVACAGLMTMPPPVDDPRDSAPYFAALARLRDRLGGATALPELSMGMSDDFEVAIAEGATLVRVGSAIFGLRD